MKKSKTGKLTKKIIAAFAAILTLLIAAVPAQADVVSCERTTLSKEESNSFWKSMPKTKKSQFSGTWQANIGIDKTKQMYVNFKGSKFYIYCFDKKNRIIFKSSHKMAYKDSRLTFFSKKKKADCTVYMPSKSVLALNALYPNVDVTVYLHKVKGSTLTSLLKHK